MKKPLLLLLTALLTLALAGCTDSLEGELMVISLSVDQSEQGVTVSIKAPNYAAQSGQSGGGGSGGSGGGGQQEQGYLTLSATGKDWAHALSQLNAATPRTLRFSHLREIIVGMETATAADFETTLRNIDRLQNVRSHAALIICEGEGKQFLSEQRAFIGTRLSKYLDITLENYEKKGYIPSTTLSEALRDWPGLWRSPIIAYAAQNALSGQSAAAPDQPVRQKAGELAREGVNKVEYVGAFALGKQGHALLTGYEVQLLHLMQGEEQTMIFAYGGRYYSAESRAGKRMRVERAGENGDCALSLYLPLIIGYSIYSEAPDSGAGAFIQGEVEALLRKLQQIGCDALGFGGVAARSFADMYQWQAYDWPARYARATLTVRVDAIARQTSDV